MKTISDEDIKTLNGIWWEIEKIRIEMDMDTEATLEDINDYLLDILKRLENQ